VKKLYISADIEGVAGIADWKETEIGEPQGAYFRKQMTREVKAVCEAALEAGAVDILVKDAHGSGRSIDPSALPVNVRLLRSWTRDPLVMMGGLDSSYEGVFFTGCHSAAGTNGNPLAHTMEVYIQEIRINGRLASEFLINAYTAASMNIPVLLLTGDSALCETAKELNPNIRTVAVSEGLGNASISIHPDLADRRIKEAVKSALAASSFDFLLTLPKTFEVSVVFKEHYRAYRGSFFPGARLSAPSEVSFSSSRWEDVLTFFFFVL